MIRKRVVLDEKSIRVKFWLYFSGMALFILLLLWLLQIVFINSFYQSMKIRETKNIGETITKEFGNENFEDSILTYSFEKSVGIQIYNDSGSLIFPLNPLDYFYQPIIQIKDFNKYFQPLIEQNLQDITYVEPFKESESSSILYVSYLGEQAGEKYFLAVSANVDPVESTVEILKNQLIIVSAISIILAFILSYFLSSRLAAPLTNMAKTARQLGRGNYDVKFQTGDYTEITDLANTLNYATGELTKTIEVRKDLIANVSHDLKTPLTVIKSYGEMIRDISGDNKELRNQHIQTILEESDYLTSFVNDLLDLSKIESELEDLHLEEFSLEELTKEVMHRFDYLRKEQGYEFPIFVQGKNDIVADKNKIRQVIYNFISNGVNYSKDKKRIEVHIEEKENWIEYSVKDFGIGIAEDKVKQIWDRYYRVRDNYERQVVGTGLGLYICQNILTLHKFDFGVESKINEGSRFYFRIPK
ncbi:HAMP domain-containing histidine kinase [Peptoniphilus sp. KCTC 25270]|uniref:sensor histidine kinase n=1 Tax=Peptoniphilus sp. KCTC 25270 TaxID=2897414 RepID=UPI001E61497E|nr:HAMP domain-containing sensor histidine kinase [Peptoniphilus sp. KCTC 25270]MCD1146941.1 HAMP domain-containing histidine kinase [Peptoniphilus sp. KCTC 25270]